MSNLSSGQLIGGSGENVASKLLNLKKEIDLEPIREELEEKFRETQGYLDLSKLNTNEPITIDTHVDLQNTPANEIVTLRVRTETGKRTLIMKLLTTDTIEQVYKLVKPYIESRDQVFVVRTNFPNRAYQRSEPKTLKELGLAPSCALIIQIP